MRPRSGFVWLVFFAGLVTASGCGGSRDGDKALDAGASSDSETARLVQLDRADQQREAQVAADELVWLLLDQSGLVEALGKPGADRLRTEFNSMFGKIPAGDLLDQLRNPGVSGNPGVAEPEKSTAVRESKRPEPIQRLLALLLPATAWAQGGESGGGGLLPSGSAAVFGMAELTMIAMSSYMGYFDNLGANAASGKLGDLTLQLERGRIQVEAEHAKSVDGAELRARNLMEVQVCPAADGTFKGSARIDVSMAKGGIGGRAEIDVQLVGTVDDDARLATVEHEYRVQMSDHGGGMAWFADASTTATVVHGPAVARVTNESSKINRVSSKIPPEMVTAYHQIGVKLGVFVAGMMTDVAKKAWESGKCVSLGYTTQPATTEGLAPSSQVSIRAAPRSLLDGTPTRGSVTASLAGKTSVAPNGTKVPADATFDYVAPNEANQAASVALEARSRRGVAKASVAFNTNELSYKVTGGGQGLELWGTVGDLGRSFVLEGRYPGSESVAVTFNPTSKKGGTFKHLSRGGGATTTGDGTYEVSEPDEAGVLTITTQGNACTDVSRICLATSEVLTLTPIR